MDQQEFVFLINANKRIIKTLHYKYCKEFCIQDISQDIILEAWKSINNFKNSCKFSTWFYAIARNVCVDKLNKKRKAPQIYGLEEYAEVLIHEDNSPELIKQLNEAKRYTTVVDSIEEPYKSIFIAYLEGDSYEQLEKRTGIPANTLRVNICRIKKRLRVRYGK